MHEREYVEALQNVESMPYCVVRKRRAERDSDSPACKRGTLQSVIVVPNRSSKNVHEQVTCGSPVHRVMRCKRYRRESTISNDSRRCQERGHSSSHDLGYYSQRDRVNHSAKSHWLGDAKTSRYAQCRRHSDSGLQTKSTVNQRQAKQRLALQRRHRRRQSDSVVAAERGLAYRSRVLVDKEGHLVFSEDDVLLKRYKLGRILGEGTFGRVVECRDLKHGDRKVAMKIVRKGCQDYESAMMEVKVLEALRSTGSDNDGLCIEMLDWFDYNGHICIVFEMLGHSVYEFLRRNSYRPFPIDQVQHIAQQLCRAVLYCHERGLTHTDLKPENLLFTDSSFRFVDPLPSNARSIHRGAARRVLSTDVKLIDFGSALFDYEPHGKVISTRQYRAPEVLLDLGWSYAADVWSVGCIIAELYTGETLFQTHDGLQHLAMMDRVIGRIPSRMAAVSPRVRYFRHGRLNWNENCREGRLVKSKCRPLKAYMVSRSSRHAQLFDLIASMLEYEPERRIDLRSALRHPFFDSLHSSSSSHSACPLRDD